MAILKALQIQKMVGIQKFLNFRDIVSLDRKELIPKYNISAKSAICCFSENYLTADINMLWFQLWIENAGYIDIIFVVLDLHNLVISWRYPECNVPASAAPAHSRLDQWKCAAPGVRQQPVGHLCPILGE